MSIPDLVISLRSDNVNEATREIIKILRPEWNRDHVVIETQTTGFLNLTLLVYSDQEKDPNNAMVIKNFHDAFCGTIPACKLTHRFLFEHGMAPKIFAFLENGICMEIIKGETLDWESERVYDDDYREHMAEEIARWHCQKMLNEARKFGIREASIPCCNYVKYWDEIFSKPPLSKWKDLYPTKEEISGVIQNIENEMKENGDLDESLVHYDLTATNTFLKVENGRGIQLIDFDFAGIGYVQQDLASFFRIFKEVSEPGSDHVPGKEYEINFLTHYLQRRNRIDSKPKPEPEDVERLYRQVQKAKVFCHFRMIVISTFLLYFKCAHTIPDCVEGGTEDGMWRFISLSTKMWREFTEYKNRVFTEFL